MGLFAGSGVGKSSLLSMIARGTDAEVSVIALVGERGREVREFLEDDLGTRRPGPLRRRGGDLGRTRPDAHARGLHRHPHRRVLPRPGPGRRPDDGLPDPRGHGPARDRPVRRRAARHPRLPAVDLFHPGPAAGARRHRRNRLRHRHLHRAGRRRRPQRTDRRRGPVHPRRARGAGPQARRHRALPVRGCARVRLPRRHQGQLPRRTSTPPPRCAGSSPPARRHRT